MAEAAAPEGSLDVPLPLIRWLTIHGAATNRKQAMELLRGRHVAV